MYICYFFVLLADDRPLILFQFLFYINENCCSDPVHTELFIRGCLSFPLGMYPEIGLQDHMTVLFFVPSKCLLSTMVTPIFISNSVSKFLFFCACACLPIPIPPPLAFWVSSQECSTIELHLSSTFLTLLCFKVLRQSLFNLLRLVANL